ncbi:histidine phosphatase family protein [Paracoccus sp. 1_MG-2023]|uniref:histidine phosphatase family protein n=1 Tax=unclassified Paracoccus (in: a-proteobacteria) TaxID=2688777 RepID=UPI001C07F532|nr:MULTISPECIES: histidine phosphatase family protein [unclassified Paracoccus (in: a-proteobacteria)]MBU2958734.1 histidine phosphatase family protein [Paracoccus sp. C2R09]MDO6667727.1 histidine phosphatase family protein [Paracoccus sp. 1_MG-2023]
MRLAIIRHAPPLHGGRLAGRRDVDADCTDAPAFAAMKRLLARRMPDAQAVASPALRCVRTASALNLPHRTDPALWEQDYGAWEGMLFADLPDIGQLAPPDLARHRPEGGESFDDMCARVQPALMAFDTDTVVVAHAGTVRAALALVAGPAALSFQVAPLSLTILGRHGRDWSVETANLIPAT